MATKSKKRAPKETTFTKAGNLVGEIAGKLSNEKDHIIGMAGNAIKKVKAVVNVIAEKNKPVVEKTIKKVKKKVAATKKAVTGKKKVKKAAKKLVKKVERKVAKKK